MGRDAWLKPLGGGRKVYVLEEADKLTPEAANALLKLLEEPPGDVLFLLLARNPGALPPTVLSRCQCLRLGRLPPLVSHRTRHSAPSARAARRVSSA